MPRVRTSRKIALGLNAALAALALSMPANATAQRVKGKFVPVEGSAPVLGGAWARPMGNNVWRVQLVLQHVHELYELYLHTATGRVDVKNCDLSHFTKKGHAHCGSADVENVTGTPDAAYLVPVAGGAEATALLKR